MLEPNYLPLSKSIIHSQKYTYSQPMKSFHFYDYKLLCVFHLIQNLKTILKIYRYIKKHKSTKITLQLWSER